MKILIYILIACIACTSNAHDRRMGNVPSIQALSQRSTSALEGRLHILRFYFDEEKIRQDSAARSMQTSEKSTRIHYEIEYDYHQTKIDRILSEAKAIKQILKKRQKSENQKSEIQTSESNKVRYHESRNYKSKLRMKMAGKKHR